MCLAKAYVSLADGTVPGDGTGLLLENVTQVEVDGDHINLRNLFGETQSLNGRIVRMDFSEGKLVLQSVEA
jgi:predicted RNA-binding protein